MAIAWFLTACGPDQAPRAQEPQSDVASPLIFRNTVIGQHSRPCQKQGLRCQVADIADVGPNRFVVGFIDGSGNLKYTYQHTTGGQEMAPFSKGTSAKWVRASTSNSWNSFGCDINYFAVQVTDPQAGHGVFLDEFSRCGSTWTMRRTLVQGLSTNAAGIPAVATKGTPLWGDLLFAWNSTSGFVGRLLRFRYQNPGGGWTGNFPISAANFSSDAIYNQHSNKWIVGAMVGNGFNFATENVVLSSADNALPAEVRRTSVGSSGDGHHTTVAYNPLSGDGSYVWWHQDGNLSKAVYVHNQDGLTVPAALPEKPNPPGFPTNYSAQDPPSSGIAWTVPVARTNSASVPYTFLMPSGFYGLRSDKTWTLLDERPLETGENTPLAVRSLATETVGLLGAEPSGNIRLVVSDAPGSPQVASGGNWMGFVNAYHTGTGDRLYKAVQTSFGGSEGWTSSPILDGFTHLAKQIETWTDGQSLQHVVYVGTDNLFRETRETSPGSNTYQHPAILGSTLKAKRFAMTTHNNGSVILIYARYPDDVLCFTRQTAPGSSTWTAESTLVGATTKARQIATAGGPGGVTQIVFTGTDDVLQTTWQSAQNSDTWTSPTQVGSSPTAARQLLLTRPSFWDLPELIYTIKSSGSADGYPVEIKQTSLGSWAAGNVIHQTSAKQIAAAHILFGHLHLVFVSATDTLNQVIRDQASGVWGGIFPLPSPAAKAKRVSVIRNGWDLRLEVFFVGLDDVVYRTSQTLSPSLGPTDFYPPVPL